MRQLILHTFLLCASFHVTIQDIVHVKASLVCEEKANKTSECTEWRAVFLNERSYKFNPYLAAIGLVHQYRKSIGRFTCDFYINHPNRFFSFLSVCEEGENGDKSFNGVFFDYQNYRYLVHYDRKLKRQYLNIHYLSKEKSLSGRGIVIDDMIIKRFSEDDPRMRWETSGGKDYFETATIELVVIVEHSFFQYFDEDEDLTEMNTHAIVNGARAIYQPLSIRIVHAGYYRIGKAKSKELMAGIGDDYSEFLNRMAKFYNLEIETKGKADDSPTARRIRGNADMVITFSSKIEDFYEINGEMIMDSVCTTQAHGIVAVRSQAFYEYGATYQRLSVDTAHEMGHSLGLGHDKDYKECVCNTRRSASCVMGPSLMVFDWSSCSTANITSYVEDARVRKNCLFTRDIYYEDVSNIDGTTIVTLRATFVGNNDVILNLNSAAFKETLHLNKSYDLESENGHICSYYHSKLGTPFAAFHWCGPNRDKSHWSGVFHLPDSRVEIVFREYRKSYVAYVSRFRTGNFSEGTRMYLKNRFVIKVSFAIDTSLRSAMDDDLNRWNEIDYDGDIDLGVLHYVLGAVNMADSLYRQIGFRLDVTQLFLTNRSMANRLKKTPSRLDMAVVHRHGYDANNHKVYPSNSTSCRDSPAPDPIIFDADQQILALDVAHKIGHMMGLSDRPQDNFDCLTPHGMCFMYAGNRYRGFVWSSFDTEQVSNLKKDCWQFVKRIHRVIRVYSHKKLLLWFLILSELVFLVLLFTGQVCDLIRPFN